MIDLSFVYLLIPLAAGICIGFLLKGKKQFNVAKIMTAVVLVLIFSLGFSIGSNQELLLALPRIGLGSLVIASLSITFSVIFVVAAKYGVKTE